MELWSCENHGTRKTKIRIILLILFLIINYKTTFFFLFIYISLFDGMQEKKSINFWHRKLENFSIPAANIE